MSENEQLEEVIKEALRKINERSEHEICRFIPTASGRIHHFSFRKLKIQNPQEAIKLIQKYILEPETPVEVPKKPPEEEKPKNKKSNQDYISKEGLDSLYEIAKGMADSESLMALIRDLDDQQTSPMLKAKSEDKWIY